MGRFSNHKSMVRQVQEIFDGKLGIGRSKKDDKVAEKVRGEITSRYIYSWKTYKAYLQHGCDFANWCKANYKVKTVADCRAYVDEYLTASINSGKSAYTVKLQASSIAKMYGCKTTDFVSTPERKRSEIKRGRATAQRVRFSENKNAELVAFCRSTGLRRSELQEVRGSDLIEKDGKYYIHVQRNTKGGRARYSPVVGSDEEIAVVVRNMKEAGDGKVWGKVSSHCNVHGYRAEYCERVYNAVARPLSEIKNERLIIYKNHVVESYRAPHRDYERYASLYTGKKDKKGLLKMLPGYRDESAIYWCQDDKAGIGYDRLALFEASQALGHNRDCIIPSHYLLKK